MAEDPRTWGRAEHVVDKVLDDFHANMHSPNPVIGLTLTRQITDALRREGLLKDDGR